MKLINVTDLTSNKPTTIKVDTLTHSDEREIVIHQISGTYMKPTNFETAWNQPGTPQDITNFISLNILDTRKLVNALLEEIRDE